MGVDLGVGGRSSRWVGGYAPPATPSSWLHRLSIGLVDNKKAMPWSHGSLFRKLAVYVPLPVVSQVY